ncbi:MAG: fimbrillin family protein [Muribaculaceae bacterium]|nr:fimbrillin family protein [Muribaculaceae bacterium]
MNNNNHYYTAFLLLPALMLFSCSQDEESLRVEADGDSEIAFTAILPGVASRSESSVTGSLDDGFHVTAFCPEDESKIDGSGSMRAYFDYQLVTKTPGMGNAFRSEMCRWPENTGTKEGTLKFFAFYPSLEVLRDRSGGNENNFKLTNSSTKKGTTITYKYVMEKFKVNRDISRHVDFVMATAQENKKNGLYSGVALQFEHQLARVDFKAWGNPTAYDVEIAGIRLGNVYTECNLDFAQKPNISYQAKDNTQNGQWLKSPTPTKGVVEYIYQEGESVIQIKNGGQYNTSAKATSLMGNAGSAFVIPAVYSYWKKTKADAGIYISVLLRVKDKDGMQQYPYIEGASMNTTTTTAKMNVIYFAVDKSTGLINKRVYKKIGEYYTDEEGTIPYTVSANEEIRDYGWAALPFSSSSNTTLKSGCQYTYTLDYTSGVGVEDPADVRPGYAIITPVTPDVSVSSFTSGGTTDVTDKITIIP